MKIIGIEEKTSRKSDETEKDGLKLKQCKRKKEQMNCVDFALRVSFDCEWMAR